MARGTKKPPLRDLPWEEVEGFLGTPPEVTVREVHGQGAAPDRRRQWRDLHSEHGFTVTSYRTSVLALAVELRGAESLISKLTERELIVFLEGFRRLVIEQARQFGGSLERQTDNTMMLVFGLPSPLPDPAQAVLVTARNIRHMFQRVQSRLDADNALELRMVVDRVQPTISSAVDGSTHYCMPPDAFAAVTDAFVIVPPQTLAYTASATQGTELDVAATPEWTVRSGPRRRAVDLFQVKT